MILVVLNTMGRFEVYKDDDLIVTLPFENPERKLKMDADDTAEVLRQIDAIKTVLGWK